MRKFILLTLFVYAKISCAEDYFNPLFLGSDVDSIDDLSYLTSGNKVAPGKYFLSVSLGQNFLTSMSITFKEDANKKVVACFTHELVDMIPFTDDISKKVRGSPAKDECIDLNRYITDFGYDIDVSKLTLTLNIPQIYLKSIRSTLAKESDWDDGIPALLTNYRFNGIYTKNKKYENYSSSYFTVENKLNIGSWRFNSSSYYNNNKSASYSSHEWRSSNIYAYTDINAIKSTLTLGHTAIGSALFDSNSYIGMSLGTSYEMLPESEKGYSPVIKGIAEARSKITIKQNGSIMYQDYIDQGPYSIDNLNSVGSSGDYEVELTTDQGVVKKYTVPYATLPNLLRNKSYNYSVAIGRLDSSQTEKAKFSQGTLSYGLPFATTVYSGYQLADNYQAFGLGLGKDLGDVGAASLDSIQAKAKVGDKTHVGNSYRVLYAKSFSETGTNLMLSGYRYSTSNYYTLNESNYQYNEQDLIGYYNQYMRGFRKKNSFQVNLTQNLGDYGQMYLWGSINSYWGNTYKSQNVQVGWNRVFPSLNNINLSASYNKNKYLSSSEDVFYLSMTMPLNIALGNDMMYLSNSSGYSKSSRYNSTSIYGNALENKLNYNLTQSFAKDSSSTSNLNATYKSDMADINAATVLSAESKSLNYGLSGSVLVHSGGVLLSRTASDTVVLVEAKGAKGAKLDRYTDQPAVNRYGYTLIPYATPYHYNDVALSPDSFGKDYDTDRKTLKVAPTRGAITKVKFDVRKGYSFLVTLNYRNKRLKFGTLVTSDTENASSIVNDDGTVYLSGVRSGSKFTVKIDSNNICKFAINYDEAKEMQNINEVKLTCQ